MYSSFFFTHSLECKDLSPFDSVLHRIFVILDPVHEHVPRRSDDNLGIRSEMLLFYSGWLKKSASHTREPKACATQAQKLLLILG